MNDRVENFVENNGVIKELERYLEEYDRVILVVNIEENLWESMYRFCRHNVISSKILLLSSDIREVTEEAVRFQRISKEAQDTMLRLHHTYEFSDRFCVLSKHRACDRREDTA